MVLPATETSDFAEATKDGIVIGHVTVQNVDGNLALKLPGIKVIQLERFLTILGLLPVTGRFEVDDGIRKATRDRMKHIQFDFKDLIAGGSKVKELAVGFIQLMVEWDDVRMEFVIEASAIGQIDIELGRNVTATGTLFLILILLGLVLHNGLLAAVHT